MTLDVRESENFRNMVKEVALSALLKGKTSGELSDPFEGLVVSIDQSLPDQLYTFSFPEEELLAKHEVGVGGSLE